MVAQNNMNKKPTKRKPVAEPKPNPALLTGVWTKEVVELLGTISDQEIAKRIGRTDSAVNIKRRILGIPAFGKSTSENKYRWSKKELAMLGKLTDAQVARETGLTSGVVAAKRRILGRPIAGGKTSRRRNWTKNEISKLGKISDIAFSKQFGINRRQVREKRYELGIAAYQPNLGIKPWDETMLRDIKKLSANDFKKKHGITHMRLTAQRIRLGILARKQRCKWTPELESELLSFGAEAFATKYGISVLAAKVKQRKLIVATSK